MLSATWPVRRPVRSWLSRSRARVVSICLGKGFLEGLREIADACGALLVFDEVQTGMARTGTWYGYQQYGVQPDVMTVAKGLAGGVACGVVIAKHEFAPSLRPGMHASTFGGNPLAMAAGLATVETIEEDGLLENCQVMSDRFRERVLGLAGRVADYPRIEGPGDDDRGRPVDSCHAGSW
ncbi:MAG: hypothetical protein CM1200mP2_08920 [Planctomycetaceae bacterium]|nr:MAG: hypothetical protein CM1200mP2_08920 [Planctomycetaceae bacterium]